MKDIPFDFGEPPARSPGDAFTAAIPGGLPRRIMLFDALAEALRFPGWWGRNWDALDEMLQELGGIEHDIVVITHADVPLLETDRQRDVYLDILASVIEKWSTSTDRRLEVWFPMSDRRMLDAWWQARQRRMSDREDAGS